MIADYKVRTVETGGTAVDTADYHINPNNIAHITSILRNMYSDPVLAVVREYTSNAIDAHVMAKVGKPILVHVPTVSEPWFSVRDFGGGLDVPNTKELLYGFGSSGEHKRTSNNQIGGFGVGCKCGFAVSDSFTYTIWHDNTKRVWSCYLDEHDNGKADMAMEVPDHDSEPGIEVRIPAKSPHAPYTTAVKNVFQYLDHKPEFDGLQVDIPARPELSFSKPVSITINGNRSAITLATRKVPGDHPTLVLGGTAYDIDVSQADPGPQDNDCPYQVNRASFLSRLEITAPIGLVQVAPNRESLQYSGRTKSVLKHILREALSTDYLRSLVEHMRRDMPGLTIKDLAIAASSLSSMLGLRETKHDWFRNGELILPPSDRWKVLDAYLDYGGARVRRPTVSDRAWRFAVPHLGRVVSLTVDDVKTSGPLVASRLIEHLDVDRKFLDADAYASDCLRIVVSQRGLEPPWCVDGSVRHYDIKDIPDTVTGSQYPFDVPAPTYRRSRRRGVSTAVGPLPQHARKFVKLDTTGMGYDSSRASSAWTPVKAADTDKGVYVIMDQFIPKLGKLSCSNYSLRAVKKALAPGDLFPGLQADGILGIRVGDADTLKGRPEFEELGAYYRRRYQETKINEDALVFGLWLRWNERYDRTGRSEPDRDSSRNLIALCAALAGQSSPAGKAASAIMKLHKGREHGETALWIDMIDRLAEAYLDDPAGVIDKIGLPVDLKKACGGWWANPKAIIGNPTATVSEGCPFAEHIHTLIRTDLGVASLLNLDQIFARCIADGEVDEKWKKEYIDRLMVLDSPEFKAYMNKRSKI